MSRVANLRSWLSGLARDPVLWRVIGTVRAATAVRRSTGFLIGELRGGIRRYRIRSGPTILVRHQTRDVALVNEIVGHLHAYEPPCELDEDLSGPLRILDLGGNVGMFGAFALGRWEVTSIRSFEPDPDNATLLAAAIAANGAQDRWTLTRAAVSNRPGRVTFLSGRLAESRLALPHESGIEVEAVDVFAVAGCVDLLKMDIEGGEWGILADSRMRGLGARVLVMEWHGLVYPGPDPHGAVVGLLRAVGYEVILDRPDPVTQATGVLWARRAR